MSILLIALVILMIVTWTVEGAPPKRRADSSNSAESKAMRFLQRFGYLRGDLKRARKPQEMKAAIAAYQKRSGLRSSGVLNRETLEQMAKPRCGVPDVGLERAGNRFHLGDGKWTKLQLLYKIREYENNGLSKYEVEQVIKRAFQMWSEVTDFTFHPLDPSAVNEQYDIDIRFLTGTHGDDIDDDAFDGPDGVMGHAFFPPDGRVHFDATEQWTMGEGTSLLQVAVHEFGHMLGLSHSENKQSVMWTPFTFQPNFQLSSEDIWRVKMLYDGEYMEDNPTYHSENVNPSYYKKSIFHGPQNSNRLQRPTFNQRPPKTFSQRRKTSSQHKHPTHGIAGRFGGDDDESGEDDEMTDTNSTIKSTTTTTTTMPNFVFPV